MKEHEKGKIQSRKEYFEARQCVVASNQHDRSPKALYDYINGNVQSKLAFYESQRNKLRSKDQFRSDDEIGNLSLNSPPQQPLPLPPALPSGPLPTSTLKLSLVKSTTKLEKTDLDKQQNHQQFKKSSQKTPNANSRLPNNSVEVLTKTKPNPNADVQTTQIFQKETIGDNDEHIKTLIVYLNLLHNNLDHQDQPTQGNGDFLRYLQQLKNITKENQELKTELNRRKAEKLDLIEERLQAEQKQNELQVQIRISEEAYLELLDYCQKLAVEAQATGKDVPKHQIFLDKRQSIEHLKLLQYQEKQIVQHREKLHQLQAEDVKHYRGKLQEAESVIGEMKQKMLQFNVEYDCAIAAYEEQIENANKTNDECKRIIETLQAALKVSGDKVLESENRIHTFKLLVESGRKKTQELEEEVVRMREDQDEKVGNCSQKICFCAESVFAEQIEITFPQSEANDVKSLKGDKEECN